MQLSEEPFVMLLFFLSFFLLLSFWLAYSSVSVCLFICFFVFPPRSPVLKGDESILCFSVWEKFQQQTFL